jgi:hypothetical protein
MWRAPSSAAFASATPLPASTYFAASVRGSSAGLASSVSLSGVEILELDLGQRAVDGARQLGRQFALLLDGLEDTRAPVLQLAQVAEPLLQLAELRVVQSARLFLTVAGDERHCRAFAQKLHRRGHLPGGDAQLGRDALVDLVHVAPGA